MLPLTVTLPSQYVTRVLLSVTSSCSASTGSRCKVRSMVGMRSVQRWIDRPALRTFPLRVALYLDIITAQMHAGAIRTYQGAAGMRVNATIFVAHVIEHEFVVIGQLHA